MRYLFLTLFIFISSNCFSVEVDMSCPNSVVNSVSKNMLDRLHKDQAKLKEQPKYMKVIINEELLPYFDYKYASYKVIGVYLKKTTKEQRDEFVEQFKEHLINAYANILLEFQDQKVKVIDNLNTKNKSIVAVSVQIFDKNNKISKLEFKLRKNKKSGEWKVFDVIAEGISMLKTKQSELGELIRKNGISHVTELLKKKNGEF